MELSGDSGKCKALEPPVLYKMSSKKKATRKVTESLMYKKRKIEERGSDDYKPLCSVTGENKVSTYIIY